MKKSTLMKVLELSNIQDYNLVVSENGFKMDFSGRGNSPSGTNSVEQSTLKKKSIMSLLMLMMLFLFTNFLFAQQTPACNLSGPLKAKFSKTGGELVTITSQVANTSANSVYLWSFKSNTSTAIFSSQNGLNYIKALSGKKAGNYTLQLKVTNPGVSPKSCTCTQSISVNNN